MKLSIIIVSWNTADLLADCLRSLLAEPDSTDSEIIVVDNGSTDGSAEMAQREFPRVMLILNQYNLGFARANNQGIRTSRGEFLLLLNSDTVVPPMVLPALVAFMEEHPAAGVCSPRLLRPDGRPQAFAFGSDPTLSYLWRRGANYLLRRRPLHDWSTDRLQEADWVSGACLLVRRAAIEQVGSLDEAFFMYFEDNDWCLRMRKARWRVYYNPQVSITHIGGQSLARNPAAHQAYYRSLKYFYSKHYGRWQQFLLRLTLPVYRLLSTG
jgi:N-acetylglucosaminyl-diphospho-decaprenol L-rhamnosyltransferase